jgi:phage terminase large subunit-like protein
LPVIFEMAPTDDWTDPAVWQRVNPGHGTTVKHDGIVQECQEALAEPRKRNDFIRYHGNRWTNQATAWIPVEWWDACQGTLDDTHLVTLECAAGLDLAQKWDLACFAVVFRELLDAPTAVDVVQQELDGSVTTKTVALNYQLFVRPFFWIPENTMRQHEKEDGVPYSYWAQQGLVTPTEGDVIDYTRIYQDITTRIVPRYPRLKEGTIGYDPAFATDLATKLRDVGGLKVLEVLQNYTMLSEPAQIVEALIKGRRVRHDGHRILRWNWENAAIKTDDAGRIRPVKPKHRAKRIDGAIATLIGQKVLSIQPPAPTYQVLILGGRR